MSCVVDKSGPALMSWQKGMWAIADAIKVKNGKCVEVIMPLAGRPCAYCACLSEACVDGGCVVVTLV